LKYDAKKRWSSHYSNMSDDSNLIVYVFFGVLALGGIIIFGFFKCMEGERNANGETFEDFVVRTQPIDPVI
jgi:hypothetical protein